VLVVVKKLNIVTVTHNEWIHSR